MKGLPYGESNPGLLGTLNPEDLKANRDSHYTIKEITCKCIQISQFGNII